MWDVTPSLALNSTILNPVLPGWHPDPSCVFVPEFDDTFFCASSSFLAFPGIPIHASKDLESWNLVSNAFNRKEQLPGLAEAADQTSGLWAPSLRYYNGTFYASTTFVNSDKPLNDSSRWDNIIFTTSDPFNSSSWSIPTHFKFNGYDPELFWDDDGQAYVVGAHPWEDYPGIEMSTIDLNTGKTGQQINLWNGTGGLAPEGPRMYKKDGYYYLLIAEGGTFTEHMVTIARSWNIWGPYEPSPANPILTNANTTQYFQAVGHADLFQDRRGVWWGVALAIRLGGGALAEPMGRETVLYPVTWNERDWPVTSPVEGVISAWSLPQPDEQSREMRGIPISAPDDISFLPGSKLPEHFCFWWFPVDNTYVISPPGHHGALRLLPSSRNLTGSMEGPSPKGVTFLGRRQVDTLFTYSIDLCFSPRDIEDEAGVTVFADAGEHIDFGIVRLASNGNDTGVYFRLRGETGSETQITPLVTALPVEWEESSLTLEIKAFNGSYYAFSAGPSAHRSAIKTFGYAPYSAVRPIFTGKLYEIAFTEC